MAWLEDEPQVSKSKSFDTTTAPSANSTPYLQRLRLGHQHYPCQILSGAQAMAVAADSAFQSNLAVCGPQLQLCDDDFSHFGAKSEISIHTTDSTVRFAVQPTYTRHRR